MRLARRRGRVRNRLARILDGKQFARQSGLGGDPLGQEIAARRIVLMQTVDAHAIERRLARRGNRVPPRVMPFVADADPIDGHEHDRLLVVGLQHDAAGRERIVHARRRRHEPIAQRRADRRRDIDLERGHAKSTARAHVGRTTCNQQQAHSRSQAVPKQ